MPSPSFGERSGGVLVTLTKTPVKMPEAVLAILKEDPSLTLAEVASRIGKSVRTVERAARKLGNQGILKYVGPQKGGHREVRR